MVGAYAVPVPPRRSVADAPTKGDRRERALLAAAERLLGEGRFDDASVADLAGAAGISRATFYFYFGSKQDLLAATIEAAVSDLESRLAPNPAGRPDAPVPEVVGGTVRAAADLWWEHRVVLRASVELGSASAEVYARNRRSIDRVSRLTADLFGDASSLPTITALVLMTERSFYDLAREERPRADYDELADLLVTIWLRALGH